MQIDPASGIPYYRQVELHYAGLIRSGALPPGAALPSVRGLAVELLVSVITVKQAYEALEAAGLVYSHQGRGTFVAPGAAAAAHARSRAALVASVTAALAAARADGLDAAELRALLLPLLETP
jgi:GntR family transcriptional regulator